MEAASRSAVGLINAHLAQPVLQATPWWQPLRSSM